MAAQLLDRRNRMLGIAGTAAVHVFVVAVVLLLATVVGYVVKARGFKANAKRGGSK